MEKKLILVLACKHKNGKIEKKFIVVFVYRQRHLCLLDEKIRILKEAKENGI